MNSYCIESLSRSMRLDFIGYEHDEIDWLLVGLVALTSVIVWKKFVEKYDKDQRVE